MSDISTTPASRSPVRTRLQAGAQVLRFVSLRVLHAVPTILLVIAVNFFALQLAPGDLVDVMTAEAGGAPAELVQHLRAQFGLDESVWRQFMLYVGNLLTLDLGYSFVNSAPVLDLIWSRLPASLLLMGTSLVVASSLGVLLGACSAHWRGRAADRVISSYSMVGFAVPLFWLALMLVIVFSVQLRWLPASGMYTLFSDLRGWALAGDVLRHLVLPVASLAFYYCAVYCRVTRASMIDVAAQDFVKHAHAKGLSAWRVTTRHILRNAMLPVLTLTGLQLGTMLGGSIVIETIFGWPGMGRLTYEAVFRRDLNLVLGILFFSSLLVIVANLLTDLCYAIFDPRIRRRQ